MTSSVHITGSLTFSSAKRLQEALEGYERRHKMPLKTKNVLAQKLSWSEDSSALTSKNQGSWEMKL